MGSFDRERESGGAGGDGGSTELTAQPTSVMRKSLRGSSYADQVQMLSPDATAQSGFQGASSPLPEAGHISRSLGADVTNVQAYSGPTAQAACESLGAQAYTVGEKVAFGTSSPSVGLQAHEAAHVVQQRGGSQQIQYKGGPEGETTAETEADAAGEKAEEDKKKEEERVAAAKASWEKLLGETIGGALFDAIREHLSPDDMLGYAKEGTKAMADNLGSLGDLVGSAGENWDGEAAKKFLEALGPKLKELSDKWLESESGQKVITAITNWVEESPGAMVAIASSLGVVAIGAAVAAYLANMDPPEFGHTFKIGKTGLSVGGSIDLTEVQNLAVQAATLTVGYQREGLNISAKGSYGEEGFSGELSMKGEADLSSAKLNGEGKLNVAEDGTVTVEVSGGASTIIAGTPVEAALSGKSGEEAEVGGSLTVGDGEFNQKITGNFKLDSGQFTLRTERGNDTLRYFQGFDMGAGGLTLTEGLNFKHGTTSLDYTETTDPDGESSHKARLADTNIGGTGLSAYGEMDTAGEGSYKLGAGYSNDILKTQFDLAMSDAATTFGTETSIKTPEGITAGFGATLNIDDALLQDFHMSFGFRDPKEFEGFLLEYRMKWAQDNQQYAHQVDAMLEHSFGIVNTRLSGSLMWNEDGVTGGSVEALAGVPITPSWMLIGGAGYTATVGDESIMHRPQISAGVQLDKVNLLLDWQPPVDDSMPSAGVFGLRAVVPLGR